MPGGPRLYRLQPLRLSCTCVHGPTHFGNLQEASPCDSREIRVSLKGVPHAHLGEDGFQVVGGGNGQFRDENLDPPGGRAKEEVRSQASGPRPRFSVAFPEDSVVSLDIAEGVNSAQTANQAALELSLPGERVQPRGHVR